MSEQIGKVEVEGLENILAYKEFLKNVGSDFGENEVNEVLKEDANPEVVNAAYDKLINTKLSDEDIETISNAIKEEAENNPDIKAMKEINEKIESGELDSKGEFINATVNVDPKTGEKQIVDIDAEDKTSDASIDEVIEGEEVIASEEAISKSINDDLSISDKDALSLVSLVSDYQKGGMTLSEVFNRLPEEMKAQFNTEASKAGIPLSNIKSYRNQFVKTFMDDLLMSAQGNQFSIDLDKQLGQIYKEYNENISTIYQSSLYEKILSMKEKIADLEACEDHENKKEKIKVLEDITHSLYESYELNDFAKFAIKAKIKPFEFEKPKKLYDDFKSKYNNSKFMIQDIENIIPVLEKQLELSEEEANEFTILFCKYTRNMKSDVLADHSFMYYFISNIISIQSKGGVIDEENTPESYFFKVLIKNINSIIDLRQSYQFDKKSNPNAIVPEYTSEKIDHENMVNIIKLAEEKAKIMEEEAKKYEEDEEPEINEDELPVEYINSVSSESESVDNE